MEMGPAAAPPRPPVAPSASASGLRGRWLLLARAVWLVVAVLTLGLDTAGIPYTYAKNRSICTEQACASLAARLTPEKAQALAEADIPLGREADLILVVPAVAEGEVDQLLEELEGPEELDGDAEDDGGDDAQGAMAELFVAVDRLQHDPADPDVAADVLYAAGAVSASSPPYGIERPVWRRIQGLASTVVTDLEEAVDDETVAADARALREYLRDLV